MKEVGIDQRFKVKTQGDDGIRELSCIAQTSIANSDAERARKVPEPGKPAGQKGARTKEQPPPVLCEGMAVPGPAGGKGSGSAASGNVGSG